MNAGRPPAPPPGKHPPGARRAEHEARLAKALRENLSKRKAQTRARAHGDKAGGGKEGGQDQG
ncbi:MAG: hypothetical protein HY521_04330 [Proteobacteria bacterium]|nr:hypothetical protein [Pseudomonadota bacterium]